MRYASVLSVPGPIVAFLVCGYNSVSEAGGVDFYTISDNCVILKNTLMCIPNERGVKLLRSQFLS